MRFVIDIDNTICKDKTTPIKDVINTINALYCKGHHIILFTARGWARPTIEEHLMVRAEVEKFAQLNKLCYDELILGKPEADYYVDDRALTPDQFVEKFNDI
ncbi:MAG: hypothetical protein R3321_02420 [Nitrososphaeraceae archaeon]|nr:hypothetical protein [Nitrososphaeraceae archaeon]